MKLKIKNVNLLMITIAMFTFSGALGLVQAKGENENVDVRIINRGKYDVVVSLQDFRKMHKAGPTESFKAVKSGQTQSFKVDLSGLPQQGYRREEILNLYIYPLLTKDVPVKLDTLKHFYIVPLFGLAQKDIMTRKIDMRENDVVVGTLDVVIIMRNENNMIDIIINSQDNSLNKQEL